MFAFFTSKAGLYVIVFILLSGIVGGTLLVVHNLRATVEQLQLNNRTLTIANESLKNDINTLKIQQEQIIRENNTARTADNNSLSRLQAYVEKATNATEKLQRIRTKKPTILIKLINRNTECQRLHFLEDGTCSNGTWKPA